MKNFSIPAIEFVACHRKPERSFFFRGKQFPVCARCTGMLIGYLAFPFFAFNLVAVSIWVALLMNTPAFIDGATQALEWRESNNKLRFITGLLSGIGQVGLIAIIGKIIGYLILNLIRGGTL